MTEKKKSRSSLFVTVEPWKCGNKYHLFILWSWDRESRTRKSYCCCLFVSQRDYIAVLRGLDVCPRLSRKNTSRVHLTHARQQNQKPVPAPTVTLCSLQRWNCQSVANAVPLVPEPWIV